MATIRYFLPEDGDVESAPNVFLGPAPARPGYPPLLGQVRGALPLPGRYHFRFKTGLAPGADREKNAVAVWMDCVDDAAPVPVWQGAIIAKVNRLSLDDEEPADDFVAAGGAAPVYSAPPRNVVEATPTPTPPVHSSDSLLGAFDDPPLAPSVSATSSVHSSAGNLLDVDPPPPAPAPAPASGGSLLDFDHHHAPHHGSRATTPTAEHHDLLNMSAPVPARGPPQRAPMQGQMPMQYPPQGQYAPQQQGQYAPQQQGMGHRPQQQQQQQRPPNNLSMKGLHDPLGDLI